MATARYRVRPAARRDLEQIWAFGAEVWSTKTADDYARALFACMAFLAEHPRAGREHAEFSPSARIWRCRSHVILYRVDGDTVEIVRIRHGREDWTVEAAEDDDDL